MMMTGLRKNIANGFASIQPNELMARRPATLFQALETERLRFLRDKLGTSPAWNRPASRKQTTAATGRRYSSANKSAAP